MTLSPEQLRGIADAQRQWAMIDRDLDRALGDALRAKVAMDRAVTLHDQSVTLLGMQSAIEAIYAAKNAVRRSREEIEGWIR